MSPEQFATQIVGICKADYYFKLNGKRPWKLVELLNIYNELQKLDPGEPLTVMVNGVEYDLQIRPKKGSLISHNV